MVRPKLISFAFIFIVFSVAFASFLSAAAIQDDLHLNIQTVDGSGNVVTGTFDFAFNISTTSNCGTVVYSNLTSLTTDARGIISYYLEDVNLDYDEQYFLCYYRDTVLIESDEIARTPYAFRARNVTLSGVEIDQNFNLGGYNLTASYLFGDGSGLTNLNVSEIDLAEYVPYTGATSNLDLGDNNFSVGTSDLFVDNVFGRVGVGTSSPLYPLHVYGESSFQNDIILANTYKIKSGASATHFISLQSDNDMVFQHYDSTGRDFIFKNSNNELLRIDNAGQVGIGTITPQNELNVIGDINATGLIYGNGSQLTGIAAGGDFSDGGDTAGADRSLGNLDAYDLSFKVDNTNVINIFSNKKIGIGSATSGTGTYSLNVFPEIGNNIRAYLGGTGTNTGSVGYFWRNVGASLSDAPVVRIVDVSSTDDQSALEVSQYGTGSIISAFDNTVEVFSLIDGGNLGLGTATPQNKLNVIGDGNVTGTMYANAFVGDGSGLTGLPSGGKWNVSGSNFYPESLSYDVGIGTVSPQNTLNVVGTANITSNMTISGMTIYQNGEDMVFRI